MATMDDLKKDFQKLAKSGDLGQGYILFGHESSGERLLFARQLAAYFETGKWEVPDRVLSDLLLIDAGKAEDGIDSIREGRIFLSRKPAVSERRLLVVNDPDELKDEAQAALLKIAEEPPSQALIILLVKNPETLLPALRSRMQSVFCSAAGSGEAGDLKAARDFLKATPAGRKEKIKALIEDIQEGGDEAQIEALVAGILTELRKDKEKNWQAIGVILTRWSAIKEFNTNRRLQLEAALTNI